VEGHLAKKELGSNNIDLLKQARQLTVLLLVVVIIDAISSSAGGKAVAWLLPSLTGVLGMPIRSQKKHGMANQFSSELTTKPQVFPYSVLERHNRTHATKNTTLEQLEQRGCDLL
jgi:hypothetical protein